MPLLGLLIFLCCTVRWTSKFLYSYILTSFAACLLLSISASTAVFLRAAALLRFCTVMKSFSSLLGGLRLRLLMASGWEALFDGDCDLLVLGLPTVLGAGWVAGSWGILVSVGKSSGPAGRPRGSASWGFGGTKCTAPFCGLNCLLYSFSAFILGQWLCHASWSPLQFAHTFCSLPLVSLVSFVIHSWVGWGSEHHPHVWGL